MSKRFTKPLPAALCLICAALLAACSAVPLLPESGEQGADPDRSEPFVFTGADLSGEEEMRAFVCGEWSILDLVVGDVGAVFHFAEDGSFELRIPGADGSELSYSGTWKLERSNEASEALSDTIVTELLSTNDPKREGAQSIGDYVIARYADCDGQEMMFIEPLGGEANVAAECSTSRDFMLARSSSGTVMPEEKRTGESFYGIIWNLEAQDSRLWVDTVEAAGEPEDGAYPEFSDVGGHAAAAYELGDADTSLGNLMYPGEVHLLRTDADGAVVFAHLYGEQGFCTVTEERALEILSEVEEFRAYLDMGMRAMYTGDVEFTDSADITVVALGTDSADSFARELYYGVSLEGEVFVYDAASDSWALVE